MRCHSGPALDVQHSARLLVCLMEFRREDHSLAREKKDLDSMGINDDGIKVRAGRALRRHESRIPILKPIFSISHSPFIDTGRELQASGLPFLNEGSELSSGTFLFFDVG